ncbi:MAG: TPM domain-containing protein [Litoreibacter sp.]|nr:TPM domain-containing protein [Litoreibacter sp.]
MLTAAQAQNLPDYTSVFVNDFADILSPETEAQLTAMLQEARDARDHEMAVVTINRRSDYGSFRDIADFSKDLFNKWGVGNAERNDGILMVVAVQDRDVRIALGTGYPARWDGIATRIIERDMLPRFRSNEYERGILDGTRASLAQLDMQSNTLPKLSFGERVEFWIDNNSGLAIPIIIVLVMTFPFVGMALPFAFFYGVRALIRMRPKKCPECGRVMLRLGDVQEDQYLTAGQILEEKLDAKNYGVWFCKHDEHLTIIGYPKWRKRHSACPNCKYHTYETRRTNLVAASYTSGGRDQLDSHCENCGHTETRVVDTPRRERSSSSSSGGSGRRSSSSFGGGSSSGGGGSGSW